MTQWLSTQALKPYSRDLDPRSIFNVIFHTARRVRTLHCWTGSHALSRSTLTQHSMQLGSDCVEAKRSFYRDPQSDLGSCLRSRVENSIVTYLLDIFIFQEVNIFMMSFLPPLDDMIKIRSITHCQKKKERLINSTVGQKIKIKKLSNP